MAEQLHSPSDFLDEVARQIAYKPLRPVIIRELQDHIEDRTYDYEDQGLSRSEAEQKALAGMGDPVTIGTEINAVRHTRTNPLLIAFTVVLMLAGLAASAYMFWTPEQQAGGFLYYIHGTVVLVFTVLYSYPLIVKHWRPLLIASFTGLFICVFIVSVFRLNWISEMVFYSFYYYFYYTALPLGPLLAIALYRVRYQPLKPFLVFALAAGWILFSSAFLNIISGIAVFFLTFLGTVIFMFYKKVLVQKYLAALLLPLTALFLLLPHQGPAFQDFLAPDTSVTRVWDDTYNGILIQELLSRTPAIGEISLTADELMNYGSGEWYFGISSEAPGNSLPRYIHYTADNVTLWDILPQHYHNNYLIAVGIFMYGKIFGVLSLAVIGAFFACMFWCVTRIRGQLAGCTAMSCALCLLAQAVLYVLGNFGWQYGYFTNMPLISEGRVSIIFNMLLLGFIFSAYRYDRVIDEPVTYRVI